MTAEHNVVSWKECWNRKMTLGGFPGGPVAKTPGSQCRGPGSIPGQGTRSQMQQLSSPAVTKTQRSQINKLKKKNEIRKRYSFQLVKMFCCVITNRSESTILIA